MADINIESLQAALNQLTETTGATTSSMDAQQKAISDAARTQNKIDKELDKYGLNLKQKNEQLEKQQKLEEAVTKAVKKSIPGFEQMTKAQQENELATRRQNTATEQTLKQLKEQNQSIQGLTREQNAAIDAQVKANKQKQLEADSTTHQGSKISSAFNQMSSASGILAAAQGAATEKFGATAAGALGVNLAFTALNTAVDFGTLGFSQWKESLDNAFQAQLAYNAQLTLGADGFKLANSQQLSRMKLEATQTRTQSDMFQKVGFGLTATAVGLLALRSSSVAATFGLTALGGPVTLVITGLTALAALFGLYAAKQKYQQAQSEEAAAQNLELQTELRDNLFKVFNDIGSAGMTGAGGMTALADEAHKAGFAIKNIDKFAGILKNSQHDMSLFGAGAVEGVSNFASVTGKMSDEFGMHFRRLGIDQEEQAAATEKYMAMQAKLGLSQGKTQEQLASGAAKYLDELDKTANMLGQTRKEQEDSRAAIMAIEQLQAAMMEARASGDKDREAELQRAINQASTLQKLDPKAAAGLAKIVSSRGAASDEDTVIALQSIPETIKAVREGIGSDFSRNQGATKELTKAYQRSAGQFAATGVDTGMTGGKYGAVAAQEIRDNKIRDAALVEANKKGIKEGTKEFDSIIEQLNTRQEADDKLTKEATQQAKDQQQAAILQDTKLLAGIGIFNAGSDKFAKAVDKFAGNTASPEASLNPTVKAVTQQAQAAHGVSRESAAMPIQAAEKVEPRPTDSKDWKKQQVWDSRYAKGWNSDGTSKSTPSSASPATIKSSNSPTVGGGRGSQGMERPESASSLLNFTSPSGTESSFNGLEQGLQSKVLAAAADYNAMTGGKLQINSAYRSPEDQKRLYQETEDAHRPGIGRDGFPVAKPGNSRHESGLSVDINNYRDAKAVSALNNQGLFQTVAGDAVHFEQARLGGVFDGSSDGYPVELHSREAVVPLPDPSSKIRIETPEKESLSSVISNNTSMTESISNTKTNDMLADLIEMMTTKMDDMINRLDQGNTYSDKLVKAMA